MILIGGICMGIELGYETLEILNAMKKEKGFETIEETIRWALDFVPDKLDDELEPPVFTLQTHYEDDYDFFEERVSWEQLMNSEIGEHFSTKAEDLSYVTFDETVDILFIDGKGALIRLNQYDFKKSDDINKPEISTTIQYYKFYSRY